MNDSISNGVSARGWLYFAIPVMSLCAERATQFIEKPPANSWEYVSLACAALVAGLTSVRAYMDQHISNVKADTK